MEYERYYELMTRGLESHTKIAANWINKNIGFFYDYFNGKDFNEDTVKKLLAVYQTGIKTGKTMRGVRMSSIFLKKSLIKEK